ncbi:MAG TPA: SHOCT domain-containing protein [Dehalococcoidia bacterium]|nr:SHOCT domain-containing protein [Dehalococcoidia bacterium]
MWGTHEGMGWWMLIGSLWFVAFWVTIIYLIIWAINRIGERRTDETPLEILRRRYARGELSEEQFEKMRRDLGG